MPQDNEACERCTELTNTIVRFVGPCDHIRAHKVLSYGTNGLLLRRHR